MLIYFGEEGRKLHELFVSFVWTKEKYSSAIISSFKFEGNQPHRSLLEQ